MQILLEKRKSLSKSSFENGGFEGQSGASRQRFHVITCRPSDEREETFADGGQRGNRVTEISAPGFIIYGSHQTLIGCCHCFCFAGCRLLPGHN
ncbi:hypothetical protein FIB18_20785 [Brucella pecoris]|uniref:Uncharacterized protein n=1 Tax=Brucella pecoris TaxID=867683 RepID=A0A5C5CDR1_9HYPH|nr:hypothetical protein FIB18_20785 [Brucella pecoris]